MALQLHHLFQFVADEAEARALLAQIGLVPVIGRRHAGQGTASNIVVLDGAFLELIWTEDDSELSSAGVVRTRLGERCRWRDNGACPFGIALTGRFPFPSWEYRAPYLPEGGGIPVSLASEDPRQPFLFKAPPLELPQVAVLPEKVAGIELSLPVAPALAVRMLADDGLLTLKPAVRHRMILTLQGDQGQRRLSLPDFAWI